jgi:uncharacterized membrane protein (GlpM family)
MAALILLLLFVTWYFHRYHPHGLFAYILAVLPLIPGFGFMVLVVPYLAEGMDEFRRSLTIQAILWGLGGVLVFASVWGSLETFVHIRHMQYSYAFFVFWICYGISYPFLLRKYR